MLHRLLASSLFVCAALSGARASELVDDLRLGMTPADLRGALTRHKIHPIDDGAEGPWRVIAFVDRLFGQEAGIVVFFENGRARLVALDFYLRSHVSPPSAALTLDECRGKLALIVEGIGASWESGSLPPRVETGDSGIVYSWTGASGYSTATLATFVPNECGSMTARRFDGSEAEMAVFLARLGARR
jgi:hypothetical protein